MINTLIEIWYCKYTYNFSLLIKISVKTTTITFVEKEDGTTPILLKEPSFYPENNLLF